MIKFFRKIRYDLMEKNKTGKYLKYAIGEIVLVVIGILIALSINNWNENRKNIAKKEMHLKALEIEFISNLTQLNIVLSYDDIVLKSTKRLLQLNPENIIEMESDSMRHRLQNSSYRWTFDPINGALRSAISSGDIHLLQNDSLIDLLFGWQDLVADAKENEQRCIAAVIASRFIVEKHIRNLNYRSVYLAEIGESKFPSDYQSLMRDPLFEDYLGERYISMDDAVGELNQVKKQNSLILELIKIELNKD
jgi:hypothetical protein